MDKLKMHTPNKADENFAKLAALFPNAVTETINENGEVVRAIDKDVLMQEISTAVVDGAEERYQFTWPDKKKAVLAANSPIAKTLRPVRNDETIPTGEDSSGKPYCSSGSVDFDNTENLYIEGDNLDVLKLLQETYLGKVKLIYIDPPYNTGKDFIYNDDYSERVDDYLEKSGQYDEEGNRLFKNTETNGRFHTDWLNMIYPRLRLAKDLLTEDGVIFISIDNAEIGVLRKVCDEVFSTNNFVGCIVLQTATDNNPGQIITEHEYILCYARNKASLDFWYLESEKGKLIESYYLGLKEKYHDDISSIQNELRKWIKENSEMLKGVTHYDNVDEKGVFHDGDIANPSFGGYKYEVIHPVTGKPCKIPDKGFRFTESTMQEMIADNDIMFGSDETTLIKPKKRLENAKDLLKSVIYEDGRSSTKHFESLMARDIFQNPKSHTILEKIIGYVVKPEDIVLDFFSGSGTTAEAIMMLNTNKENYHVKFIMVQLPEDLDATYDKATDKAKKTIKNAISFLNDINKTHVISEIGKERIRRAGAKIKEENPMTTAGLDTGFRVLKLDSTNMKDVYYNPDELTIETLMGTVDNIKEDRTPEDLLFQVMLDLGVLLSSKIEQTVIGGKTVYNVADGFLIACFDENVTEETITAVAKMKPYYFVMRDSSMAGDSVAANFDQIFEAYSKDTVRKVI